MAPPANLLQGTLDLLILKTLSLGERHGVAIARRIGTFEVSAEPFHDCCPLFLPRSPALYASAADLEKVAVAAPFDWTNAY